MCVYTFGDVRSTFYSFDIRAQVKNMKNERWLQSSCLARCWGGSCLCLLAFLKWLHGALQRKLLPRQAALNQRGCGLPKATKTDTRPKQILGPNFVPRSFDSQLKESTWRFTGKEVKETQLCAFIAFMLHSWCVRRVPSRTPVVCIRKHGANKQDKQDNQRPDAGPQVLRKNIGRTHKC